MQTLAKSEKEQSNSTQRRPTNSLNSASALKFIGISFLPTRPPYSSASPLILMTRTFPFEWNSKTFGPVVRLPPKRMSNRRRMRLCRARTSFSNSSNSRSSCASSALSDSSIINRCFPVALNERIREFVWIEPCAPLDAGSAFECRSHLD